MNAFHTFIFQLIAETNTGAKVKLGVCDKYAQKNCDIQNHNNHTINSSTQQSFITFSS